MEITTCTFGAHTPFPQYFGRKIAHYLFFELKARQFSPSGEAFGNLLSSSGAVAQGGPRVPWPSPSHWWPQAWTCSPLLFPPAARRPTWASASCQSLLPPTENHLLPLEKSLSKLLCSCQPTGDRSWPSPWLLTLPGAARPPLHWSSAATASLSSCVCAAPVILEFAFPVYQLLVFCPAPLWFAAGSREGLWAPPQGRPHISECARRGERKCW